MKIALFGGSFNPPHIGHIQAANFILDNYDVDGMLVIPVFKHAFSKELASFEHRLNMLRLAFKRDKIEISDIERRLGESRTLTTIQALQEERPDCSFRLIVGSDILYERHKWYKFDEIEKLATPIVLERQGYEHKEAANADMPDISSTTIRAILSIRGGASKLAQEYLSEEVYQYIVQNKLYT